MATSELLSNLTTVYQLVIDHPPHATFSVVGIILLGLAFVFVLKHKSQHMPRGLLYLLLLCISSGIAFSAFAPALAILNASNEGLNAAQNMENLRTNREVKWAVRLIAYDPAKQPELSIAQLTKLGRENHRFIFVADYNELKGYTVYEAVRKLGGEITETQHVTAIIFPLDSQTFPENNKAVLYPANARGLLQVVQRIEEENSNLPPGRDFQSFNEELNKSLNGIEREQLKTKNDIPDWSWEKYGESYRRYCTIAQKFRCDRPYTAKSQIGEISKDWHPLGFARIRPEEPCDESSTRRFCEIKDWTNDTEDLEEVFGARVFLVHNFRISDLVGHMLIHFNSPKTQEIPDIGSKSAEK